MSLPTVSKTWRFSLNNALLTNSSSPGDYASRIFDAADYYGTVVTEILSLSSTYSIPISIVGSSDGVNNTYPATINNGINYWIAGSASFRSGLSAATSYSYAQSVWIVLQFPNGQLMMVFQQNGPVIFTYWSESSGFTAATSVNGRPTALDEVLVSYSAGDKYSSNGILNSENLGIINTACSYTDYTQKVSIAVAQDASGFWAFSARSGVIANIIWFGGLTNPVYTTPPYDWGSARVMWMSGTPTLAKVIGTYYNYIGLQSRSTLDTNGVKWAIPSIGPVDNNINSSNYQSVALNPLSFSGSPDTDTGVYPIYPIGCYSPSRNGLKGTLTDIWWGSAGGNGSAYPATGSPSYQFIQVADFILPWDSSTTPEFT